MTGVYSNEAGNVDEFYHSIKTLEDDHLRIFEGDDLKLHEENNFLREPNSKNKLFQDSFLEPLPFYPGSTQAASSLCRKRRLPMSNALTIEPNFKAITENNDFEKRKILKSSASVEIKYCDQDNEGSSLSESEMSIERKKGYARYSPEEEKALVYAGLHIHLSGTFMTSEVKTSQKDVLKAMYIHYLGHDTDRDASALLRHYKEIKSKKKNVSKYLDGKDKFGSLCASLVQYLLSSKTNV